MQKNLKKQKAFSFIGLKSFLMVSSLLLLIIIISGILTNFIPQGSFERDENGMIINETFKLGEVHGIAFWRVVSAPFRVFVSEDALTIIVISVLLLVMSSVFNLLEKTGGINTIVRKTVKRFSSKKNLVICLTALVFMTFGSFFGMFEELVTLLPLVIVFVLSLGFDTLTGLGVCMLSACFGFSAAISNPFSVGIVSEIANTNIFSGVWLRILFFVIIYFSVCTFLILHINKITKNPTKSLTYEIDREKLKNENFNEHERIINEDKIFKTYVTFFAVQLVIILLIASIRAISSYAIPVLAVSFLLGGIICGCIVCDKKSDVFFFMKDGALSMLPAVAMIALASSVKLIMMESGILDTIMHFIIQSLSGKSKFASILLIYLLILFLQIFIGSSSAKIMLIMPIILPIAKTIGLSTEIIILTYCIADGFTDVIIPTNPVLLIGLSMANVSYGKWFKWTWKFQIAMLLLTASILFLAVNIGY